MSVEIQFLKDILVNEKIEAMKSFDKTKTNIINVILAETSRKIDPLHPVDSVIDTQELITHTIKENKEIIGVCKKLLASNSEIIDSTDPTKSKETEDRFKRLLSENEYIEDFLEKYAPKQLNRDDLTDIVRNYLNEHENAKIGDIMKYFKFNYDGRFDGKTLSEIAQLQLSVKPTKK